MQHDPHIAIRPFLDLDKMIPAAKCPYLIFSRVKFFLDYLYAGSVEKSRPFSLFVVMFESYRYSISYFTHDRFEFIGVCPECSNDAVAPGLEKVKYL